MSKIYDYTFWEQCSLVIEKFTLSLSPAKPNSLHSPLFSVSESPTFHLLHSTTLFSDYVINCSLHSVFVLNFVYGFTSMYLKGVKMVVLGLNCTLLLIWFCYCLNFVTLVLFCIVEVKWLG